MAKQSGFPFEFDITKFMGDMKVPGLDMDGIMAAQKKNIDALNAANKLAFDSVQAVMTRQGELLRQSVEEASAAANAMTDQAPINEKAAKQAELAKQALERAVSNAREVAEMIARSNKEMADLMQGRMTEALAELQSALGKAKK